MKHFLAAFVFCIAVGDVCAQETPLDTRRRKTLQTIDQAPVFAGNPSWPQPNLSLKPSFNEADYLEKILAILGLVDLGATPSTRISEANQLLRHAMLGRWPAASAQSIVGQYSSAWAHRARSLAIRLWFLYSAWLDADLKQEYVKRFQWLLIPPYTGSSENIKLNTTNAIFLAHEILGQTASATYQQNREWLISYLKGFGKDGSHEWGAGYNGWTIGAVLNLAEFAQDPTVRKVAEMGVDYWLARTSGFQIGGVFCSGGVRRYGHGMFASENPQTRVMRILFFGPSGGQGEWAVTNYRPLVSVHNLFVNAGPAEARVTEQMWRYRNHRGESFSLATQFNVEPDYYVSTHDESTCYVQSSGGPLNHVIPYGIPVGLSKWRSTVDRSFGYQNVALLHGGGFCRRTWTGSVQHDVPIRLFYHKNFSVEIQGKWAFLTDGTTYVAWSPGLGHPVVDAESNEVWVEGNAGKWLRSDAIPTDAGESSVLEAGDAASFGSYAAFKSSILSRNPNPDSSSGQIVYKAKDGAMLILGPGYATVNGQAWSPSSHPRAQMPGVNGFSIAGGIAFNFNTVSTTGTLSRVGVNHTFGITGPAPLQITTPQTLPSGHQWASWTKTLAAAGGTPPYVKWVKIWGTLPPGLQVSTAGVISGTPTEQGTWTFRIRVIDSTGAVTSRLFTLTIGAPLPLQVTTPGTLPNAKKNVAYSKTLAATGGTFLYIKWVKIWGTLPPGLQVSTAGVISGTPTAAGTWTFRIRVIDSSGAVTSRLFSLKVNP